MNLRSITRLTLALAAAGSLGMIAAAGPAAAHGHTVATYPGGDWVVAQPEPDRYHMAITAIRFTALNDCDWVGKGDFTLGYSLTDTRHESRFGLYGGQTKTLYPSGVSRSWVAEGTWVKLRWDWEERDPVYWGATIGDAPLNESIYVQPVVGPANYTVYDTEGGCRIRVRFTVWSQLIDDPPVVD